MRMNRLLVVVALPALVVLGMQAICFAQVPTIDIPESALTADTLPPAYIRPIDEWVKRCLNTLSASKDDKAVNQAAAGLMQGYMRYDSQAYRYEYGRRLGELSTPALGKLQDNPLVQLSVVLAQVPEVTMQDCLETMIRHPAPAVRYLGWKGYLNGGIRNRMLTSGSRPANAMMDLLAKRAKEETAPSVFGPILDMLRVPTGLGTPAGDAASKQAQKRAWDIFQQLWPTLCLHTMSGEAEISRACRQGVITMDYFSQTLDAKEKNKLYQMLVNMMYCASRAYDDAGGEGVLADINGQLARDCEVLLGTMNGASKTFVQKALEIKDAKSRQTDVPLAVLDWVSELKSKGVVEPKFETAAPSSAPAAPASKPATAASAPK